LIEAHELDANDPLVSNKSTEFAYKMRGKRRERGSNAVGANGEQKGKGKVRSPLSPQPPYPLLEENSAPNLQMTEELVE
jgi:hypothetical protein